jgi:3-hydroxyisobutyrate dehydrogenase-like beta-hydroxyacid dehydrogenase
MPGEVIGFVGVGRMGGPMAGRLMDAGHKLVVFDAQGAAAKPLVERGAELGSSPQDVASRAEMILISLPTPDVVKSVVLGETGLIHGSRAKVVVDLSTTGPSTAALVAKELAAKSIDWVDSPVSGGIAGAVNGTLAVIVSCKRPVYERIEPILTTFGKLFFTGERPGLAQSAKLANNLLAASALVITSEAMAMAVKSGVDAKTMIDIINVSSGRNSASQDKFPKAVLTRTFDFGFETGLSYKDVRLCIDEAEAMGVPMVAGSAVRQMLAVTQARFGAKSDFTHIAKVVEEWAGVEIGPSKP